MAKRSDSCWPLSGLLFYPPVSGSPVYGEQSRAFSFGNTGCGIRGTGTVWIFWVHPGAFGALLVEDLVEVWAGEKTETGK